MLHVNELLGVLDLMHFTLPLNELRDENRIIYGGLLLLQIPILVLKRIGVLMDQLRLI